MPKQLSFKFVQSAANRNTEFFPTERLVKTLTSQFSFEFVQGMADRMDTSMFKYGALRDNTEGIYTSEFVEDFTAAIKQLVDRWNNRRGTSAPTNVLLSLLDRLRWYVGGGTLSKPGSRKEIAAGNTEYLIDAANMAMIEFMRPQINGAVFRAADSDESPGVRGVTVGELKRAAEELSTTIR
jgi:hypothetical protein